MLVKTLSSSLSSFSSSHACSIQTTPHLLPFRAFAANYTLSTIASQISYQTGNCSHLCSCSSLTGCVRPSFAFPESYQSSLRPQIVRCNCCSLTKPLPELSAKLKKRTAILWFKNDLRVDDHPGLVAASSCSILVPLFIFDPALFKGWTDDLLESLIDAVMNLRLNLQSLGSDLLLEEGASEYILQRVIKQVEATHIIAEEEVDHGRKALVSTVYKSLSRLSIRESSVEFSQYRLSLYEAEKLNELPESYKEFQKLKISVVHPVAPPQFLPPFPGCVHRGTVPSLYHLANILKSHQAESPWVERNLALKEYSANMLLKSVTDEMMDAENFTESNFWGLKGIFTWREKHLLASPFEALKKRTKELPDEIHTEEKLFSRGGETGALNALQSYFKYLEASGRDDWVKLHRAIWMTESRPGTSFRKLFGISLAVGTLSWRRVYQAALEYERARSRSLLSSLGFIRFTVVAAIAEAQSNQWHKILALRSQEQSNNKDWQVDTWIWRGFLIQYTTQGEKGEAVVLIHGFGAFWQHFRQNIEGLVQMQKRVWAISLLGFGKSEKPNILYTEVVWAELVRDFIMEVVREPVALAGNSIGGYIVALVAGLWPSLVRSLILLNTAGRVVPEYASLKYVKPARKSDIAWIGARFLLLYLQAQCHNTLKKCYPVNASRADNWLLGEVLRASYDPGAIAVLESIFYLRAPLPLNFFLNRFDGKVLVIQGIKDPLQNSSKKASMLKACCKNVSVALVNAGHCPHDEIPEEVNGIICNWLVSV